MADPRNPISELEVAYVRATDSARRTVAAAFDLHELPRDHLPGVPRNLFRAVWRVELDDATLPVPFLLVAIPWVLPDRLPHIYLPTEVRHGEVRIPHLDRRLHLCTFDDSAAWPNADLPGEAVCRVIVRAVELLRAGISGDNSSDYADEFESYWLDSPRSHEMVLADIRPEKPHRRLVALPLRPTLGPYTHLVAETVDAATAVCRAFGEARQSTSTRPVLYLHLDNADGLVGIETNADVSRYASASPSVYGELLDFLAKTPRPAIVLFSIPIRGERSLGGWVHSAHAISIANGRNGRRKRNQFPGFRPGGLSPATELTLAFGGHAVTRIGVRRIDAERLVARTAGRTMDPAKRVSVVGCGSVGGFIADTVRHFQPEQLTLVDPQTLDVHNIPRHFCDMSAVGLNKARAVSLALSCFDPHLQPRAYDGDVLDILRTDAGRLTPSEWTFIAVGNVAVERRVNALSRRIALGTVVYVWVGPHAIEGHAVVVPSAARGCFECLLDSDGHVGVRVLEDPGRFERADAGCRASYLPYSGLDVQTFARDMTRAVLTRTETREPVVLTWIGDIDRARNEGWKIHDDWSDAKPFSIRARPIPARADCRICGESR